MDNNELYRVTFQRPADDKKIYAILSTGLIKRIHDNSPNVSFWESGNKLFTESLEPNELISESKLLTLIDNAIDMW